MKKNKLIITLLAIMLLVSAVGCNEQRGKDTYPSKPITWIVPFGTGGGSDQFARIMEKQIEEVSDLEVVVINIPGAKTTVGLNKLIKENADGYTVFGATTDSIISMSNNVTKYSIDDIVPIAKVQHNVDMWFINSEDERFSSYDELIKYAKENEEEVSIATTGLDGADVYSIRKIEKKEKVKFKIIPFSEPGERYAALAGGHVDVLHEQPGDVLSFLESDKYKPIITMSEKRIEGFKEVPSTIEKEIDVTSGYWRGIWMKEGTSTEATNYITDVIKKAVNTEEYKKYEKDKYLDLREGLLTGKELKEFISDEYEFYKQK